MAWCKEGTAGGGGKGSVRDSGHSGYLLPSQGNHFRFYLEEVFPHGQVQCK